jgi:hypothetical protein
VVELALVLQQEEVMGVTLLSILLLQMAVAVALLLHLELAQQIEMALMAVLAAVVVMILG